MRKKFPAQDSLGSNRCHTCSRHIIMCIIVLIYIYIHNINDKLLAMLTLQQRLSLVICCSPTFQWLDLQPCQVDTPSSSRQKLGVFSIFCNSWSCSAMALGVPWLGIQSLRSDPQGQSAISLIPFRWKSGTFTTNCCIRQQTRTWRIHLEHRGLRGCFPVHTVNLLQ